MTEEKITDRSDHALPYGRKLNFKDVAHADGFNLLRMTIREGRRFTIIDLDENSAKALSADLADWANNTSPTTKQT